MIAPLLVLAVIALAAYRLARAWTTDSVAEATRERIKAWGYIDPDADEPQWRLVGPSSAAGAARWQVVLTVVRGKFTDLISCPHCLGYWIGVGMLCTWAALWPWDLGWRGWVTTLAVAGVQSFLSAVDGRDG